MYEGKTVLPQDSHYSRVFTVIWMSSLLRPQRSQHRQNIPQTEIVMHLLAQLFFTELVEHEELSGQSYVVFEPARRQLYSHYDLKQIHNSL